MKAFNQAGTIKERKAQIPKEKLQRRGQAREINHFVQL